jgi:hypothetical protein
MWEQKRIIGVGLAVAVLAVQATGAIAAAPIEAAKAGPAQVQLIDGSKLRRVTLTQRAAQRLDIQTAQVGQGPSGLTIAPYASILYDLSGAAWVYTSPQPLIFVRQGVVVEAVKGGDAYLKDGPPAGTQVVTVGVAELYGTEKGVGH